MWTTQVLTLCYYSMINMHDKLRHTTINSVTFFLTGLRTVRQQMLSILGLYQGHNRSQNSKLSQAPSCKGNRTTAFSSCVPTSKHELKTLVQPVRYQANLFLKCHYVRNPNLKIFAIKYLIICEITKGCIYATEQAGNSRQ